MQIPYNPIQVAELLFPDVKQTPSDIFAQYPKRDLPEGAIVTRFAPSPTGFVHIGSIYIAVLGRMFATNSQGVFILRIEDTDQTRRVERGIEMIVESTRDFNVTFDEGVFHAEPLEEHGQYGPYQQSQRKHIYHAFAKQLVAAGKAYPSFQTDEELAIIRSGQEKAKVKPGYYGPWAADRMLTQDQIEKALAEGKPFVIRNRAPYPADSKIVVEDAIRGALELPANDQDMVLIKSDGLPTYHFAHVVDDSTMQVNLILRADEWLATLPLHVQLFQALELPVPLFAHIAPIGKMDGNSKRKLSKRKDPEAAVSYFTEKGYPLMAILEYLLNIANSSFEDWRKENPELAVNAFDLKLSAMSSSPALFDLVKLDSISRDMIARMTAEEVYQALLEWAQTYDAEMERLLKHDTAYTVKVLDVERGGEKPRKDLTYWSEFYKAYGFFFDELYTKSIQEGYQMPDTAPPAEVVRVVEALIPTLATMGDKDTWLNTMRDLSAALSYAPDRKSYKQAPEQFKGQFGDFMMIYRVALTNQRLTPDLYEMIQTMGVERVQHRLNQVLAWANA